MLAVPVSKNLEDIPERDVNAMTEKFHSLLIYYAGSNPLNRPRIPVLRNIRKTRVTIMQVNNVFLKTYLVGTLNLKDVHLALYCTAVTIIEISDQKNLHS